MKRTIEPLSKYLPEGASDFMVGLLMNYNVIIHVVNSRKTKSGDFRPSRNSTLPHRISLNSNLSPEAFLLILLHEIAHLITWEKFKRNVRPHGIEWKKVYAEILTDVTKAENISEEIKRSIGKYLQKGIKSTISDIEFIRNMNFSDGENPPVFVADIPFGTIFTLESGKSFKKGVKLRSRYKCICINNNRNYLVGAAARVIHTTDN